MNDKLLQDLLASTLGPDYTPIVIDNPGYGVCLVALTGPFGGTWTKLYDNTNEITFHQVHKDICLGLKL